MGVMKFRLPPTEVLGVGQAGLASDEADASARAFVVIAPGTLDSELARLDLDAGVHPPLCELAP